MDSTAIAQFKQANERVLNTTTAPNCVRYVLVLRPLSDKSDPRGIRRLRALLKFALRTLRLRCESAKEATDT